MCVIDILWDMCGFFLWKANNVLQLLMRFKTVLDESGCNRSMRLRLEYKDTEIYSKHNEGKSVVTEKFIRALKK